MDKDRIIPPGSTLGMLGGGQLGRMSILAGRRLGYGFQVFEPAPGGPASMIADVEHNADYTDAVALEAFAHAVDRITLEFENIPSAPLEKIERITDVAPSRAVLHITQNRRREKEFLQANNFPCAPFAVVGSLAELEKAVARIGFPCVLKTADFGYDGKGQRKLSAQDDLQEVWDSFPAPLAVLEGWIQFEGEFSVICARNGRGEEAVFPIAENIHRHHILHTSIVPARITPARAAEAEDLARRIARQLDVVGLIAVELFLTPAGWVVNELAPRPHNSGHYSFDACLTSQFEQHIRAVCNLPLGDTALLRPVVMVNLLGDVWTQGTPDWTRLLREPQAKLHLYGKKEARPGRKMGHFCVFGDTAEAALEKARALEDALRQS